MATCKDCIHEEACNIFAGDLNEDGAEKCICFKDRNRFVELPCKVGDTVYYITGIGHNLVKPAKVKEIILDENGIKDLYVQGDGHNFEKKERSKMNNNEFIRGKRAEIDLVSDGIYNCEELKELIKAFDISELKLKNEVVPEEFYVSSTNDITYIIPINNDRYIKIGYEDYFKLQDNGDGIITFSRPATKSEIQEILDCLKEQYEINGSDDND